ncbi:MAG: diacylglycerol kinase family protein, partial [Deltaproteobacteria bacterium]
ASLKKSGMPPTIFSVKTPAEILSHCREINESEEAPLVIVAGGDGTFNAVVNGLNPGKATLAILPMGTSNVLAAEIGITSITNGLERIAKGEKHPLSLGLLESPGSSHRFVLMAGIGTDGAVVRNVCPLGKRLLKQVAYALSAIASIFKWDYSMMEIVTSEKVVSCHSVIVCNASRYGGDFILAPEVNIFSPELTAICISNNRRSTYLQLALELLAGKLYTSNEITRIPANGIEILGTKPIQLDGDFVGYSPARLKSIANFARIIV